MSVVERSGGESPAEGAFERLVEEGDERLSRAWLPLIATGLLGGVDVGTGVLAYFLVQHYTHNTLLAGFSRSGDPATSCWSAAIFRMTSPLAPHFESVYAPESAYPPDASDEICVNGVCRGALASLNRDPAHPATMQPRARLHPGLCASSPRRDCQARAALRSTIWSSPSRMRMAQRSLAAVLPQRLLGATSEGVS